MNFTVLQAATIVFLTAMAERTTAAATNLTTFATARNDFPMNDLEILFLSLLAPEPILFFIL
jgi:hypothetical protein